MKLVNTSLKRKLRIAFLGVGVGLHAEKGEGQGMPMLIALLERLCKDFDVVVYSLIRVKESSLPDGILLKQIISDKVPGYLRYLILVFTMALDHLRTPFALINAISAFPSGRIAVIFGAIFRRPVLVHLIGSETVMMPSINYGDLLVPRLRNITGWVCRKADVLIVQTEYQRKMTRKNLQLQREITVLSRRVDVKKFPFRERSIAYPVQFLHVASYHAVKDQETLFRAFEKIARHVDCCLKLIGDGFGHSTVKQLLTDLKIEHKVKWVGMVRHSEIWRHFDQAHILLHTSRYESLCGVVQEAMANGVPVCGTEVGILADLGDPFAVVVPPNEPEALAEATLALIRDPERYHRQEQLAREYIVNHDADWAAENYKDLFMKWIR